MSAWFLRLRWRHKAIVVCLALAAAILAVRFAAAGAKAAEAGPASSCRGVPRAPSVRWFQANPWGLDCILAECEDNPGLFARTPACVTAQSAAFARLRDLYAGQPQTRRPPPEPAAPQRPRPVRPVARRYSL